MEIKKSEILHLAELSNLSLSEEQLSSLGADLEKIIAYISQLDELDTEGVEATYQCFEMQNVWREDEVEEFEAKRDDLLNLSQENFNNQIKVPKVL